MSKQLITNYPRKNTDWKYVNFLEDKIKILEEELRIEKKFHAKDRQERNYLKLQTIPQLEENIKGFKNLNNSLMIENRKLKNKISYYKQSLL